jgi:HD-GYP domain-containing protein (c-di-GMP phosphodiesterase class II)
MMHRVTGTSAQIEDVRLAELLAVLSLGADLGMNQPMEHVLRQSLIALRLGELLGFDDSARASLYHSSLIVWVGCHIDAYEQAKWFGDDFALKGDFRMIDATGVITPLKYMASHLGAGHPLLARARIGVRFVAGGHRDIDGMIANHWYAADTLAHRLGLDQAVRDTIEQSFERWDGKGMPHGVRGDDLLLPARIVALADVLEVYHRTSGEAGAITVARERSGTQFDPALVDLVAVEAPALFESLDEATWATVIDAEPGLTAPLADDALDDALEAIADFVDIKSPFTLGHSRGVAELAAIAATSIGLDSESACHVRRAGLLHDVGRLGVSNAVWDKAAALSGAERERVRLHPYITDRMLASSPTLAQYGATAIQHHERLDGSGYPRGVGRESLSPMGRVLAAADAYHAKLEPRPHRDALAAPEAMTWLRAEVRDGRLDGDAVEGVLAAAGHPVRRRKQWPADLTSREIDVLRLLARGLTNSEIAAALVISVKTAGNHVEHIYAKIGVNNRARASLFAVQHGIMDHPAKMG